MIFFFIEIISLYFSYKEMISISLSFNIKFFFIEMMFFFIEIITLYFSYKK